MHGKGAAIVAFDKRTQRYATRVHTQNVVQLLAGNPNAPDTGCDAVQHEREWQRMPKGVRRDICAPWHLSVNVLYVPVILYQGKGRVDAIIGAACQCGQIKMRGHGDAPWCGCGGIRRSAFI